ncbi:M50 family metallopeptidase [Halobacillus shinanisalinarum]|uniref:M50 family metallopeptidase n=1 Tax=Halobacillus shinanisalinarum TaxID=2932258 RepID=A0ABY4GVK0_9BACI|nr:site-2 protease family protein [Halobacillus shinanisalinarum]UOQ92200.1 M50 family metallopeptidase [Halobacillus shinanisalinarum]
MILGIYNKLNKLFGMEVFSIFTLSDIPMFFVNFFLILPIVTLVHEAGHVLVARLFGGKIKFCIGTGETLLNIGSLEVKKKYFMEGLCQYEKLTYNKTWAHVSIYLAGSIFNLVVILIVNSLIFADILPKSLFFNQFVYFSFYFIFFSLMPFKNDGGKPSDGMAAYEVIKYGKAKDPID